MIRGGCLCGDVRFEITGKLTGASHCHCSMCRKAHGAAFGTYGLVKASEFRIASGADRITRYRSSPDVERTFCGRCGSTLQWLRLSKPDIVDIALSDHFMGAIGIAMLAFERGERELLETALARLRVGLASAGELNLVPQWWCHRLGIHLLDDLWSSSFH